MKINGGRAIEGILRGFDPFMNLVLDEAIEITKAGDKNQIGMIVLRGNSVVMLEAKDRLWMSTGLSWSVDNFWWKLPLKAFCPIFLSFCNKKHIIEEFVSISFVFNFSWNHLNPEITKCIYRHPFYNFFLFQIFRENILLLKTHTFLVISISNSHSIESYLLDSIIIRLQLKSLYVDFLKAFDFLIQLERILFQHLKNSLSIVSKYKSSELYFYC